MGQYFSTVVNKSVHPPFLWYALFMKLLIKNATILPMTEKDLIIKGSLAIEGASIVAIGEIPPSFIADRTIDANSSLLMPSFVNSHTHLSMTYFRNFKDSEKNLQHWLQAVWALEDKLLPGDIYAATMIAILEMISGGTTTVSDMYFFPEGSVEAALEAKIKLNVGLTLFGGKEESHQRLNERVPLLRDYRKSSYGQILFDIAPHAIYTCTKESYHLAIERALLEQCRIHTHASETKEEVENSLAENGLPPIEYLHSLGLFEGEAYLAHGVFPTEKEISLLAAKKIPIVHNPSSNAKLGCGIAPIAHYKNRGVPLALGTDGPASNNALDMFLEMRLAAMLSSVSNHDPVALTPFEIVQMATLGGAVALGRERECGTIEVGKDADFILIDTDTPHWLPHNNLYNALIFSAKSSDVHTVVCKGQILYDNREFTTIDEEKIKATFLKKWSEIQRR